MKIRFLLVLWVGCVFCAHAQDPYKARVDYIFGSLNQAEINTGILTDYGLSLIDHTLYDGVIYTNNTIIMQTCRTSQNAKDSLSISCEESKINKYYKL